MRRVVGRNGRGKAYVNGSMVTVGVLARLTRGLVDIAGQHEHVSLFDSSLHRTLLDRYGNLSEALQVYGQHYAALREVEARMESLGGDEARVRERAEFLRFQLDEINRLDPEPGEDAKLDVERRRLGGAEKLKRQSVEAELLICGEESSALETVGRAMGLLNDAVRCDATLGPIVQSLSTAMAELEDVQRRLNRYSEGLESDPARLGEVEERLDAIKRLCRKHGTSLEGRPPEAWRAGGGAVHAGEPEGDPRAAREGAARGRGARERECYSSVAGSCCMCG